MFGLVANDPLFLTVDEQNRSTFTERGLKPFVSVKDGKAMAHCAAPRHQTVRRLDSQSEPSS